MPTYEVDVVLTFETNAPNTTEVKGRIKDLEVHKLLGGKDLQCQLIYRRKKLVPKIRRIE